MGGIGEVSGDVVAALRPSTRVPKVVITHSGCTSLRCAIAARAASSLSNELRRNDRDSVGGSGILEVTFRPLSFVEHRTFAKRSHVKHRKVFDMTYIGSTRVVDQASAHSLPLTVAGRHIALAVAGRHLNPTNSTHGNRNPLD